ncbi:MAG: carboxymuconolactone decarboxylase family protein [SAR324 cluster bacterium]|nr:carboxymuconolactone decarboxylase family protein [SAR324 cluster bacterium]
MAHNTSLGQAAGISEEQIQAIGSDEYMDSPLLSAREKAAVLWAEHVTKNTARSRDDVFEEVKKHFSEQEIVELTLMSGFFNLFNRLMDSLRIPVELPDEVDKIKRSVHLDPDNVKKYFQNVLDNWPDKFPVPIPDSKD